MICIARSCLHPDPLSSLLRVSSGSSLAVALSARPGDAWGGLGQGVDVAECTPRRACRLARTVEFRESGGIAGCHWCSRRGTRWAQGPDTAVGPGRMAGCSK